VRARIRLVDARAGALRWAGQFEAPTGDLGQASLAAASALVSALGAEPVKSYESLANLAAEFDGEAAGVAAQAVQAVLGNELEAGIRLSGELVAMAPSNASAQCLLAWAWNNRAFAERTPQILANLQVHLTRLLQLDSRHPYAMFIEAQQLRLSGALLESERAHLGLLERTDLGPSLRAHVVRSLATVYNKSGDSARALAMAVRARDMDPTNPKSYQRLAAVMLSNGREVEALENAERAVATGPTDWVTRHLLGLALGRLGRFREAAIACEAACSMSQGQSACADCANYLLLAGERKRALEFALFSEGLAIDNYGQWNLGEFWVRWGDSPRARGAFRRALDLGIVDMDLIHDPPLVGLEDDPVVREAFDAMRARAQSQH